MSDIAIKVQGLKKRYRLGEIGGTTLNSALQSWWARKRGKEDPNLKIGQSYSNNRKEFWALNGIDLEVKKGEALGIIGFNGAGKSTFLKVLSRITAPTEGDVWINGRISSMLEVGTGFHGEMTGRENIYMNGAILGMSRKEIEAKMESIIDFSECRQFIDTPVKRYSSGMYVKLAFAVASHLDSEIMIMDEVLAVGDAAFQKKCLARMSDAAMTEGRTVLYVSHNMMTIRNLCTRCIVLNNGQIIFEGDVEKAIEIYMNNNASKLLTKYCFDGQKRSIADRGTKVFIHHFEFLEKQAAQYYSNEQMKFRLDLEAFSDIEDLRVRLEIRTSDGQNVGMSESKPLIQVSCGNRCAFDFVYDISNLADGSYTLKLALFLLLESGKHAAYDETSEIPFEIVNNQQKGTTWMPQRWGRVKLPGVEKIATVTLH